MTGTPRSDAVVEGGDLDCGSGLLLLIREAMSPLPAGGVLEVRSREISVREDLPAWCRMVGHAMLASEPGENASTSYFVRKQAADTQFAADLAKARDFAWTTRVRWTERCVTPFPHSWIDAYRTCAPSPTTTSAIASENPLPRSGET